jgi:DNA-binding NarL/FixJ family response regulator
VPRRSRTLARPRVLLADDNLHLLRAATELLLPHFDVVGTVQDGAELVLEASRSHPDVIVADVLMSIVNGLEAVHSLREMNSSAKFVFLSVHPEQEIVEACMSEGALGYVLKSTMKSDLISAIKAALAGEHYISPSVAANQAKSNRSATRPEGSETDDR